MPLVNRITSDKESLDRGRIEVCDVIEVWDFDDGQYHIKAYREYQFKEGVRQRVEVVMNVPLNSLIRAVETVPCRSTSSDGSSVS